MAKCGKLAELLAVETALQIRRGLAYLAGLDQSAPAPAPGSGSVRVEIDGDEIFALHQSYFTKPAAEGRFEAHGKYADIQYIVSGSEIIRTAKREGRVEAVPYDGAADIAFFELGEGEDHRLAAGMAAIIPPGELHAPCLCDGEPALVVKVVVKVRA